MKRNLRALLPIAIGFALVLFATAPLYAAEGEAQDPVAATMGTFFKWLNFVIVFGGIAYLLAKSGSFFQKNAKMISAKITEASTAKAAADAELQEVETKISRLSRDVDALREEASREAAAETKRLHESTKIEIEKINQAAQVELVAAERAARQELRGVAASLAVQRAGVAVSSRMTPDVRARLFRTFLGEIRGNKN